MLQWGLDFLSGLAGFASDPVGAVTGWTFDKVTQGIYEWLARGLALLIEWVWELLDAGTTPRLTEDWYANELAGRVGALALAVTVAMMLASAIQAALAGRPEQVGDAVKEAARAIVASALTITVVDVMVGVVDEASAAVWAIGRDDLVTVIEGVVRVVAESGPLGRTFVGVLCQLFGYAGLLGLSVSLFMRTALIYLAAALAPLVWSSSVLPLMRDSSRRLVHLLVALIVSKLAIVISLVVAVQLVAHAGGDDGTVRGDSDAAAAVGTLLTGFACFLVAAISPMVLYRLMPTVEGAVASAGVVGGWGRSLLSVGQAALLAKGGVGMAAASKGVAGQGGVPGAEAASATSDAAAGGGGRGGRPGQAATQRTAATGGVGQGNGAGGGGQGGGSGDGNLPPLPSTSDGGPAGPGGAGERPSGGGGAGPSAVSSGGLPPLPGGPSPASPPPSRGGQRPSTGSGRAPVQRPVGPAGEGGSR